MYKKTIGIIAVGLLMGMFLTVSIMQSSCCARNKTHKKTKIDDYTIIDFPTPNIESGTNLCKALSCTTPPRSMLSVHWVRSVTPREASAAML